MSPDSAFGDGVNWAKVADTVKALVFSPIMGFVLAALLLLVAKACFAIRHSSRLPRETPRRPSGSAHCWY
ncbi:MAG TPA: hypothetical protein VFO44_10915 [Steroidobacteraceae bacterium]|nr:hypothetical protein [Steroidobacteraceae bacterium]